MLMAIEQSAGSGQSGWAFKNTGDTETPDQPQPQQTASAVQEISWSASEYIHHDKGAGWFVIYGLSSIVGITFIYVLTRDYISIVVLSVLAIGFGVFAGRKPETLNYLIDSSGVHIGSKLYPINMFKSFAVVEEGAINSIALIPLKRFMPTIAMYCAPEDEKKIIDSLSTMLPQEERQQDRVDKLMHKIRF